MNSVTGGNLRIAVGSGDAGSALAKKLSGLPFPIASCASLIELTDFDPSVILVDEVLLAGAPLADIRRELPAVPVIAPNGLCPEAEFPIQDSLSEDAVCKLVKTACELYVARVTAARSQEIAQSAQSHLTRLADISVALSAERDINRLLKLILEAAQDIACCDAASLFLLDNGVTPNELVFKLTLNDSVNVPFSEQRFAVDERSISGFVTTTGEAVHCEDVYLMGPEQPFRFNADFDKQANYRTRSLFCVPMLDNGDNVIGVLQFINRKRRRDDIVSPENVDATVIDFDPQVRQSLEAMGSLSAVALQNRKLIDDINTLFESFVQASVTAIEQRDPTTSGHSFRVADLSVALARQVHTAARSDLQRFQPTEKKLRELRYASLLHDFGKVGVRESVLVKSKKLYAGELTELRYRLALTRQRLRADAAERIIALHEKGLGQDPKVSAIREAFKAESRQLDHFLELILEANEPSVLAEESATQLASLGRVDCDEDNGEMAPLLSEQHIAALSIKRGSLTQQERLEIESHVVHTYNFLTMIPWTEDLAGIPDIAGRHHEKLDGSGYPDSLIAADIPVQSRVMTICDIFDALTASDRPYKPAMPEEVAYRILREDAHRGMLDRDIVEVFIGADVSAATRGKQYPRAEGIATSNFFNSVCDPDAHGHLAH